MDRINAMEQFVLRNGTASLEDLTNEFQVSLNTVRRDVEALLNRGHIRKTYGGVVSIEKSNPVPMAVRSSQNQDGKQMIGRLAAELVKDSQTIFLDSGSTALSLLSYLNGRRNVTVVTHSLPALYEASKYSNLKLIALSGTYSPPTNSFVGNSTLEALRRISVDAAFIAATGVSLERGLTNATHPEAEIKQRVMQHAGRVVLLADHTKFDSISNFSFFDLKNLSALVTDERPTGAYQRYLETNHVRLLCE